MARRKKAEQLSMNFDPREKENKLKKKAKKSLTLQDVHEIVDYYTYYGEFASVEFGQKDLIALGKECLRLIELLKDIEQMDDINEIKKLVKESVYDNKRF